MTDLADEVGTFLFVLLGDDDGVLPDGVVALVGLAGLQLGDDIEVLLLLEVLVEGEGVVLLLRLALAAGAALGLLAFGGSLTLGRGGSGPSVGGSLSGAPPVGGGGLGLCLRVGLSSDLGL